MFKLVLGTEVTVDDTLYYFISLELISNFHLFILL